MKDNKRHSFRSRIFVLFLLVCGTLFLWPVTRILLAKQEDVPEAPATPQFTVEMPVVPDAPAIPQFAVEMPAVPDAPMADFPIAAPLLANQNPFGVALQPDMQFPRLFNADPMRSFVEKIRDAKDKEAKQEAIAQAKAALEKHYDKYIAAYEQQVDEMESRLEKLRDQLDKRKEAKDRLVSLKLEMITSQADGIGWPEGSAQPNTPFFERSAGTIWRTSPLSPVVPSGVRTVPAPSANVQPARIAASLSTTVPRRGITAVAPRGLLYSSAANQTDFRAYFDNGIQLLQEGKYGEFLDRYLPPDEFRKRLKSATLDEVSKQFEKESADLTAQLFKAASKDPARSYDSKTKTLAWEPITVDGSKQQLELVRDGDQWYLSLQNSQQGSRQTR